MILEARFQEPVRLIGLASCGSRLDDRIVQQDAEIERFNTVIGILEAAAKRDVALISELCDALEEEFGESRDLTQSQRRPWNLILQGREATKMIDETEAPGGAYRGDHSRARRTNRPSSFQTLASPGVDHRISGCAGVVRRT